MTSILGLIFGPRSSPPPLPGAGDIVYSRAMAESEDIMRRMRESSNSTDAARAIMADVWAQKNNIPFMVTIYEANEEMKAAVDQKPVQR